MNKTSDLNAQTLQVQSSAAILDWILAGALFALILGAHALSAGMTPFDDEGYFLQFAKYLDAGKLQYIDIPNEYGPLLHPLNSIVLKLCGGYSHHSSRIATGILLWIVALEIFAVSRRLIFGRMFQFFPSLVWLGLAAPKINFGPSAGWYIAVITGFVGIAICSARKNFIWPVLGASVGLIAGLKAHLLLFPLSVSICIAADRLVTKSKLSIKLILVFTAILPWLFLLSPRLFSLAGLGSPVPLLVALALPFVVVVLGHRFKREGTTQISENSFGQSLKLFVTGGIAASLLSAPFLLQRHYLEKIYYFMFKLPRERYAAFFPDSFVTSTEALLCLTLAVFISFGLAYSGKKLTRIKYVDRYLWLPVIMLASPIATLDYVYQLGPFANFYKIAWPFFYLSAVLRGGKKHQIERQQLYGLACLSSFAYLQLYPTDSWAHVAFATPLGSVLMLSLLQNDPNKANGSLSARAVQIASIFPFLVLLASPFKHIDFFTEKNHLKGAQYLDMDSQWKVQTENIVEFIKENSKPGDCLLTIPGSYSFNLWTGLPPATALMPSTWIYLPKEIQEGVIPSLSCARFALIDKLNPRFEHEQRKDLPFEASPLIFEYVESNYWRVNDPRVDSGRFILFDRQTTPPNKLPGED